VVKFRQGLKLGIQNQIATMCQGCAEQKQSDLEWSRVTLEWKGFDNKSGGTTLVSARVLCLNLLSVRATGVEDSRRFLS